MGLPLLLPYSSQPQVNKREVPVATATNNGAMSSEDWVKLNALASPSNLYSTAAGLTLTADQVATLAIVSVNRNDNPQEGDTGIVLPNPTATSLGSKAVVKDSTGSAGAEARIAISPSGGSQIDGQSAIYITTPYGYVTFAVVQTDSAGSKLWGQIA